MLSLVAAWLRVLATDPLSGAWWDAAKTSFVILALVTVVIASVTGIVTWPPEKRRMEATIKTLTDALRDANENTQRTLPATARVVEFVEQRTISPPSLPETPANVTIDRDELLAVLRDFAQGASSTVGATKVAEDEQG